MKCPYCQMVPWSTNGDIVQFACGMVMAIECVQQAKPDEIDAGRLYQPTACIRGERDRYLRQAQKLRAAGNALARHVAEDTLGETARQLVEAWEDAAR